MEIEKIYYFTLIPITMVILFFMDYLKKQNEKKLAQWGDAKILSDLTLGDISKKHFSYLLPLALLSIIIALANPRWGVESETLTSRGSDVYIALDISKSMDANDISPSRLLKTKDYVSTLVTALKGNNIGLILFAGSAFLQIPLTNDYAAVRMMINSLSTDFAGDQGTNLSEVGSLVNKANQKNGSQNNHLIIITDGEDHEDEGLTALKDIATKGTTIYCIGVGTEEGGFIPTPNGYKKDENGDVIKTKLNIELINEVAKIGHGKAYNMEDQNSIKSMVTDINGGSQSKKTNKAYATYKHMFPVFLALGLILLIADILLSKKRHYLPKILKLK
ncbi:MAG: hypothetical protein RLZZ546_3375 [Bacteroidota bacterium]